MVLRSVRRHSAERRTEGAFPSSHLAPRGAEGETQADLSCRPGKGQSRTSSNQISLICFDLPGRGTPHPPLPKMSLPNGFQPGTIPLSRIFRHTKPSSSAMNRRHDPISRDIQACTNSHENKSREAYTLSETLIQRLLLEVSWVGLRSRLGTLDATLDQSGGPPLPRPRDPGWLFPPSLPPSPISRDKKTRSSRRAMPSPSSIPGNPLDGGGGGVGRKGSEQKHEDPLPRSREFSQPEPTKHAGLLLRSRVARHVLRRRPNHPYTPAVWGHLVFSLRFRDPKETASSESENATTSPEGSNSRPCVPSRSYQANRALPPHIPVFFFLLYFLVVTRTRPASRDTS